MSIKKELTMKAAAEIFKLASRIGIKPRDIIGQGADVIKMGKSLFNTKVNPKLTEFISKKGEVPTKILEEIKVHIRSLKNASDDQIELFKINLKDIVNAKFPEKSFLEMMADKGHKVLTPGTKEYEAYLKKTRWHKADQPPVTGDKKLATDILPKYKETPGEWIKGQTMGTKEYYLNELRIAYPNHYRTLTGKETTKELKEIIYRLDTEGIPFESGGMAKLNAELNQLPEYYLPMAEGGRIPYGIGDWVKKKIKKKIKPYTKEGRDEHKKEWLEKKNIDMTVEEWNALPLKEKIKIAIREGNADGGIANHFRTR